MKLNILIFITCRKYSAVMVQLSSGGPASSCRSWSGPLLQKAHDLKGRRNGRGHIMEDKGMQTYKSMFNSLKSYELNTAQSLGL